MRSEAPAISSARSTPNGVSIITMTGSASPPARSSAATQSSTSWRLSTRGKRIAWAPARASARRSASNHGEPRRFTRTITSRWP
jgi:hypothetical protein